MTRTPETLQGMDTPYRNLPKDPATDFDAGTGVGDEYQRGAVWWPFWARDAREGAKRINARVESIARTATFREVMKKRRYPVPRLMLLYFYIWHLLTLPVR